MALMMRSTAAKPATFALFYSYSKFSSSLSFTDRVFGAEEAKLKENCYVTTVAEEIDSEHEPKSTDFPEFGSARR